MGKHWLDGKYAFKGTPWLCNEVKGDVAFWRNLAEFDHPELEVGSLEGTVFVHFCPDCQLKNWREQKSWGNQGSIKFFIFCQFQELGNMENSTKR